MPARALPNLGLKAFYTPGEDGWGDDMSLNLLKLSALTQGGAIAKVAAVAGTPPDGDVYILDETHATNPNEVVIYDAGAPVYVQPSEGWLIYDRTANAYLTFDGALWSALGTGGGGGGIEEAPSDGTPYARQDETWVPAPGGGGGGGGLGWTLHEIWDGAVEADTPSIVFANLDSYDEVWIFLENLISAASIVPMAFLSFDNGVTRYNVNEYPQTVGNGSQGPQSSGFQMSTGSRTDHVSRIHIMNLRAEDWKLADGGAYGGVARVTQAANAIIIHGPGADVNFTGGRAICYAR